MAAHTRVIDPAALARDRARLQMVRRVASACLTVLSGTRTQRFEDLGLASKVGVVELEQAPRVFDGVLQCLLPPA